ncbi:MAG: protein disulfide oxidoreductase [Sandaracinaceae bacterium]
MSEDPPPEESLPVKRRNARRRLAVEVGFVILLFIGIRLWQQRDVVSGEAPSLSGVDVAGEPFTLTPDPDRATLVHFWATWCGVCKTEEDNIDALVGTDYRVVTVASQSGRSDAVARYLEEHQLEFDVVMDPAGRIAHQWGVSAFPTSFVIAPDGTIEYTEVGYTSEAGLRTRLWLAER